MFDGLTLRDYVELGLLLILTGNQVARWIVKREASAPLVECVIGNQTFCIAGGNWW